MTRMLYMYLISLSIGLIGALYDNSCIQGGPGHMCLMSITMSGTN
jgi:hypothetical protein